MRVSPQQALTEGRLDELCITTQLERPIPRPPLVDRREPADLAVHHLGITFFHLLIPLAFLPYFFSWWGLLWLPIGNYIFCSMGIGAGYHRLLTHRGYKCPLWLEHTLAVLGLLQFAGVAGPLGRRASPASSAFRS